MRNLMFAAPARRLMLAAILCAGLVAMTASCNREKAAEEQARVARALAEARAREAAGYAYPQVTSVGLVVEHPENFNHRKIRVAGCYAKAAEQNVLGTCGAAATPANAVWIDGTGFAGATAARFADPDWKLAAAVPKRTSDEQQAYVQFWQAPPGKYKATLDGEFQHAESGPYGVSNSPVGFKNRLVVHSVVEMTPEEKKK